MTSIKGTAGTAGTAAESHMEVFEQHRPLLFGIAWRMLGNPADAEDILQEGLLRWLRTSGDEVRSPRAFLVTMITRLCLNHLDLARVKREVPFDVHESQERFIPHADPAEDADLADALDAAFSIVLKCLSPIERAIFLLREVFECEYSEVARIVEKSEDNCRQIVSRARERIAGRGTRFDITAEQQESVLREFLKASESGDLDRLAQMLCRDSTLVSDGENLGAAAPAPIHGAASVSRCLLEKLEGLRSTGAAFYRSSFRDFPLLLAFKGQRLVKAFALVIRSNQVQAVYLVNCPVRLRSIAAQYQDAAGRPLPQ